MRALSASTSSVIWAVVPADVNVQPYLASPELVVHLSHTFSLQLVKPLNPERFWLNAPTSCVHVKTLLVFSTSLSPSQQIAWSMVAPTLPTLLQGAGCSLRTDEEHRISHVPANWWWGTETSSRASMLLTGTPPRALNRRYRCSGNALCGAVCTPAFQHSTFSRYLGNLGIPPVPVTDLLAQHGAPLLEGDREPPRWVSTTWHSLRLLHKAAKKLA